MCCKTIFTTEMSNIDSRMDTSAQYRSKNLLNQIRILPARHSASSFAPSGASIQNASGLPQGPAHPAKVGSMMRQSGCALQHLVGFDRRRHRPTCELIPLVGGVSVACPLAPPAQQPAINHARVTAN
jgi:hypothetical protein